MRTPLGGPAGATDIVFPGAGLVNFEGLEIVGGGLFFFARDVIDPSKRALYRVGLTGGGTWDGAAPARLLGGLAAAPAGDGSDELDFDPVTGRLYGTNMINGEVIYWDVAGASGGFLITALDITTGGPALARLGTAKLDGIRATSTGFLIVTGLDGVLASINLSGIAADGLDDADIKILYDSVPLGTGFHFDDLTPLADVPEPATTGFTALCLALMGGAWTRWRRKPNG